MKNHIKVEQLRYVDDLESLVRGNVVSTVFKNRPDSEYSTKEFMAVYHGKNKSGELQFLEIRGDRINPYIITYNAKMPQLEVHKGRVIIDDTESTVESITTDKREYAELHQTLQLARVEQYQIE